MQKPNFFVALRQTVLMSAFLAATKALAFADELAAAAGDLAASPKGKGTVEQVKRTIQQPVVDIDKLDDSQVRSMLANLLSRQSTSREAVKTIRFNDGTEATHYTKGEKMLTGGIAKGGEVKSARDSGTLSCYGFGRNPISMYANQWIELLQYGPAVLRFIGENLDHINEYVRTRNKGSVERDIDLATVNTLLGQWGEDPVIIEDDEAKAGGTAEAATTAE